MQNWGILIDVSFLWQCDCCKSHSLAMHLLYTLSASMLAVTRQKLILFIILQPRLHWKLIAPNGALLLARERDLDVLMYEPSLLPVKKWLVPIFSILVLTVTLNIVFVANFWSNSHFDMVESIELQNLLYAFFSYIERVQQVQGWKLIIVLVGKGTRKKGNIVFNNSLTQASKLASVPYT